MRERNIIGAFGLMLALVSATPLPAQYSGQGGPLPLDRVAYIEPGTYLAGDSIQFTLDSAGGNFLLRLRGSPEVFVLYVDHGSLGGRILKYDSGETALNVAGWGGMTLYTDAQPQGLPAVRTGDSAPPSPPFVSLQDMQNAAADEAEHLAYVRRVNIQIGADWNLLGDNAGMRAFAYDAMENAARGIERFCSAAGARDAFTKRVSMMMIVAGNKPTMGLNGRTLTVTFNAGSGFEGRASSRAIARALGNILASR